MADISEQQDTHEKDTSIEARSLEEARSTTEIGPSIETKSATETRSLEEARSTTKTKSSTETRSSTGTKPSTATKSSTEARSSEEEEEVRMNRLGDLISSSVKEYLEIKENESDQCTTGKLMNENDKKRNGQSNCNDKTKKRKIEDESSDDERFELPRRRVMTMGEFNKRKRMMTKYHRDLIKEREEEQFFAQAFDEEYDDSLADFVVGEFIII